MSAPQTPRSTGSRRSTVSTKSEADVGFQSLIEKLKKSFDLITDLERRIGAVSSGESITVLGTQYTRTNINSLGTSFKKGLDHLRVLHSNAMRAKRKPAKGRVTPHGKGLLKLEVLNDKALTFFRKYLPDLVRDLLLNQPETQGLTISNIVASLFRAYANRNGFIGLATRNQGKTVTSTQFPAVAQGRGLKKPTKTKPNPAYDALKASIVINGQYMGVDNVLYTTFKDEFNQLYFDSLDNIIEKYDLDISNLPALPLKAGSKTVNKNDPTYPAARSARNTSLSLIADQIIAQAQAKSRAGGERELPNAFDPRNFLQIKLTGLAHLVMKASYEIPAELQGFLPENYDQSTKDQLKQYSKLISDYKLAYNQDKDAHKAAGGKIKDFEGSNPLLYDYVALARQVPGFAENTILHYQAMADAQRQDLTQKIPSE